MEFTEIKNRDVPFLSGFQKNLTLVLCVPKKTKSVVLLCSIPPLMRVMKRRNQK